MYDLVYEQMEEAGVARKLETPEWQNRAGDRCGEAEAVGYKVTHDLTHPEMCVVMDEVGSNTSQKGDGRIGAKC